MHESDIQLKDEWRDTTVYDVEGSRQRGSLV